MTNKESVKDYTKQIQINTIVGLVDGLKKRKGWFVQENLRDAISSGGKRYKDGLTDMYNTIIKHIDLVTDIMDV